jgi:two-component system, LuxR family, response regulator FixJ
VYIVDDDAGLRVIVRGMLRDPSVRFEEFESAESFLTGYSDRPSGCVLLDVRLPGMNGLEVLERISVLQPPNAIIMLSGFGDIPSAVRAVKMGAADFVQKPFRKDQLVEVVRKAFESVEAMAKTSRQMEALTPREREVLIAFREGEQNKVVAARLGLSPRTVEMYRARLFAKLGVSNLPQALLKAREAGLIG